MNQQKEKNQWKKAVKTNKLKLKIVSKTTKTAMKKIFFNMNWMNLFQLKNTNRLSLEDICEHLQLHIGDV
ncbi:hypothetical protein Smp_072610 [Schistosoma mansoni]|uniref:hypothetical protein n=1 Tax=Schistosoma mansoni TaxID=6183 RepID=UPI00022DC0A8|nr:hypothetical protein Smp_072610 [Schistosoma mansoni]|eukprot:XP_018649281.1 hypothetical protein Smp_072610 [Schistosoma mansoni]